MSPPSAAAAKAWQKKALDPEQVRALSKRFQVDVLLSSILARRGCTQGEELLFFLEQHERYLYNPFLLSEMEEATERVAMAMDEGEQILIFGDRDADGVCSTVLLYSGLLDLGMSAEHLRFQTPVGSDAYGLSREVFDEAVRRGETLIITADCGCANHEEIAYGRELGVDVVVLDHHTPKEERPSAYALVNPHSASYPFRGLCAASVSGKFLWALAYRIFVQSNEPQSFCLLDITVMAGEGGNSGPAESLSASIGGASPGASGAKGRGAPGGGILVRAAKIRELMLQSQLELEIQSAQDAERLFYYIENELLCSFESQETLQGLKAIFGNTADIYLIDLQQELLQTFPALGEHLKQVTKNQQAKQGQSSSSEGLRRTEILRLSRLARYRDMDPFESQIELLISLFRQKLKLPQQVLTQSLDLMAIASIADMMPLRGENRIIVKLGLERIREQARPGLRELLLELGLLGQSLSAKDLGWKLIPILNAAGRMGQTQLVTRLFTAQSADERRNCAQQLIALNEERKELSQQFFHSTQGAAEKSFTASEGRLVYVAIPDMPRGITGLIAGRLSQQYRVPAVVLAQDTQTGDWSGSLRSNGRVSVLALLDPLAERFSNYGGHSAAGGFGLSAQREQGLEEAMYKLLPLPFEKSAPARLTEGAPLAADPAGGTEAAEETYAIDAEIPAELLDMRLLERLWQPLSPYGMDWPELLLLTQGLELEDVQAIGRPEDGHLRLSLRSWDQTQEEKEEEEDQIPSKPISAVFWRSAERLQKDFTKGDRIDILYHIQPNIFQGQIRLQLEIVDIRRS